MIIGIDGNEANQKIRVGSGVYVYNLLWQMYRQVQKSQPKADQPQVENIKYQIYLKDNPNSDLPATAEYWKYKVIRPKKFWTQIGLPATLFKEKIIGYAPDVFFSPTHYAPRFCPVPSVVTIYDLAFIRFPEMFLKKDLWQLKNWTEYSVKQAKKIITISQFSKKEIIDFYKIGTDKVVVAYPGFDAERFNIKIKNQKSQPKADQPLAEKIKNKYKINGEYILYIGTIQPRKNLVRLVEAFKMLKQVQHDKSKVDLKLVIAGMIDEGRGGWMNEEFTQTKKKDVIITGFIKENDLQYLIAGAKTLVLPSLYEGFGIPVVEAMASGIPVVVSNTSSLPEVVGDSGILVDPYNPDNISEGIKEACYNKSRREELIKKGLEQVRKFSWESSTKIILDTLQSVIHDRN